MGTVDKQGVVRKWGLKNPKSAEAILLQGCSKEATLCPISHMLN